MNTVPYEPEPVSRRVRMRTAMRDWAAFFKDDCDCRFCRAYREFYDFGPVDLEGPEPEPLDMPNMGEFVD